MKLIFTLAFLFVTHASISNENKSEAINKNPIQWTLTDINGAVHNFPESESNKTTVVFFWATWCPFCKRLMPHLQSINYQYGEALDLQIFALSINDDGDPNKVIEENGYDFLLFKDADEVAKNYQVRGTPGLLVFDKLGQLQFDLRTVEIPETIKLKGNPNSKKAIKLAPFWSSELRKVLNNMIHKD